MLLRSSPQQPEEWASQRAGEHAHLEHARAVVLHSEVHARPLENNSLRETRPSGVAGPWQDLCRGFLCGLSPTQFSYGFFVQYCF
jgi:hypothetical protein